MDDDDECSVVIVVVVKAFLTVSCCSHKLIEHRSHLVVSRHSYVHF